MVKAKRRYDMTPQEREEHDAEKRRRAVRGFLREFASPWKPVKKAPSQDGAIRPSEQDESMREILLRLTDQIEALQDDARAIELLSEAFGSGAEDTLKTLRRYRRMRKSGKRRGFRKPENS